MSQDDLNPPPPAPPGGDAPPPPGGSAPPPPDPPPPGGPPAAPPPSAPPSGPLERVGAWFNEAWQLLQPAWLEYLIALLVYYLVLTVAFSLCFLPGLLLMGPLTGGAFVFCANRILGRPSEVGDIFKGFRRFGDTTILALVMFLVPMLFGGLLLLPTVLSAVGAGASTGAMADFLEAIGGITSCFGCFGIPLFLILYPIVVGTLFVFAFPLVMFKQRSAIDALKESYQLVKPNLVVFLLLLLATWLIVMVASAVGNLLICIGAFIFTPLAMGLVFTMQLLAYRDYVGLSEEDLAPYA